jgi:hypothetical protein
MQPSLRAKHRHVRVILIAMHCTKRFEFPLPLVLLSFAPKLKLLKPHKCQNNLNTFLLELAMVRTTYCATAFGI